MPTRTGSAIKKCLFGGTLIAAGLATPDAHAQTFDFSSSSALASTAYGGNDAFNGPGTWDLESEFCWWPVSGGEAYSWGTPTDVGVTAYSFGGPASYASCDSHFTVTSDTTITLDWYLYQTTVLTDLTNGLVLLSTAEEGPIGSEDIQLLAGTEYEFSSAASFGYAYMTIQPPPEGACCLADGCCVDASAAECASAGGAYQGDATTCADVECKPPPDCPADVTSDGVVDVGDLVEVILDWGPCKDPCGSDVNADGLVDVQDIVAVILAWGSCG